MLKFAFSVLVFTLIAFGVSAGSDESSYQRANAAVWGAIESSEAGKGGAENEQALNIQKRVSEWISSGAYSQEKEAAQAIYDTTMEAREQSGMFGDQEEAVERIRMPGKVYVFVSKSMPTGVLRSLFQSLNTRDLEFEVEVAFRGLFEGDKTFIDFSNSAGQLVSDLGLKESDAVVGMNPTAFREFSVTSVPQLVYVHEDGSISRRKGSVNVRDFHRSLGDTGSDHQKTGETYKIAERDFFEEIEERLAKIDWDKKIEVARDNYWNKIDGEFKNLQQSSLYEVRDVDMTVVVSSNIIANDGIRDHIIAREGERFNPLDQPIMAAFNRNMIILDPNSPSQLDWAKKAVGESLVRNERPVVLLVKFLEGEREKTLEQMEGFLKSHTYLADKRILSRFGITAVPVSIKKSPVSGYMRVTQYACNYQSCGK